MKLLIKVENQETKKIYENHKTYHEGDAGLDLFIPETVTFQPGETKLISLGISVEAIDKMNNNNNGMSFHIYARSSIYKTPLRLANSVGIIDKGYRGLFIRIGFGSYKSK